MDKLIKEIETIKPIKVWTFSSIEGVTIKGVEYEKEVSYTIQFSDREGAFIPVYLSLEELFSDKIVTRHITTHINQQFKDQADIRISCVEFSKLERLIKTYDSCQGIILRPENKVFYK